MFINEKDRQGTVYFEFQFCKIKNPVRFNKVRCCKIKHFKDDSLLLHDDDAENFFKLYIDIFKCALLPNGEIGYNGFCPNYYDKETTKIILSKLRGLIKEEYKELIPFLEEALNKYNGFYILGI